MRPDPGPHYERGRAGAAGFLFRSGLLGPAGAVLFSVTADPDRDDVAGWLAGIRAVLPPGSVLHVSGPRGTGVWSHQEVPPP
jgi:hypothetical protein